MEATFTNPVQHRVTGAVPVRLNASRVPNVRYSSTESLNSMESDQSDPQDTIETRLIATHQISGMFLPMFSQSFSSLMSWSPRV